MPRTTDHLGPLDDPRPDRLTARMRRCARREASLGNIIVRDAAGRIRARIPNASCSWCRPNDWTPSICSACGSKLDRARAGIAKTDARRAAIAKAEGREVA